MSRSHKIWLLTSLYVAQGLPYGFFTQALARAAARRRPVAQGDQRDEPAVPAVGAQVPVGAVRRSSRHPPAMAAAAAAVGRRGRARAVADRPRPRLPGRAGRRVPVQRDRRLPGRRDRRTRGAHSRHPRARPRERHPGRRVPDRHDPRRRAAALGVRPHRLGDDVRVHGGPAGGHGAAGALAARATAAGRPRCAPVPASSRPDGSSACACRAWARSSR